MWLCRDVAWLYNGRHRVISNAADAHTQTFDHSFSKKSIIVLFACSCNACCDFCVLPFLIYFIHLSPNYAACCYTGSTMLELQQLIICSNCTLIKTLQSLMHYRQQLFQIKLLMWLIFILYQVSGLFPLVCCCSWCLFMWHLWSEDELRTNILDTGVQRSKLKLSMTLYPSHTPEHES